jgi:mRNA interferase HigB
MHIITRKRLIEFGAKYPDAMRPLDDWFRIMRAGHFVSPNELKEAFPSASLLGGGLTVFNIAGNKYRLAVTIRYALGRVFIRHVMTHTEYIRRSHKGVL